MSIPMAPHLGGWTEPVVVAPSMVSSDLPGHLPALCPALGSPPRPRPRGSSGWRWGTPGGESPGLRGGPGWGGVAGCAAGHLVLWYSPHSVTSPPHGVPPARPGEGALQAGANARPNCASTIAVESQGWPPHHRRPGRGRIQGPSRGCAGGQCGAFCTLAGVKLADLVYVIDGAGLGRPVDRPEVGRVDRGLLTQATDIHLVGGGRGSWVGG